MADKKTVKVKLVQEPRSAPRESHRATVRGLGLRKTQQRQRRSRTRPPCAA